MTHSSTKPVIEVPIACTLPAGEQADRVQHWRTVLARATTRTTSDAGVRLTFPADPNLVGDLAALAVREQQCCAFFTFTLHVASSDEVSFEVTAPPDALEIVATLFA